MPTDYQDEVWSGISITVIVEGLADVHDVVYPAAVQANEPFTITYQVTNTGNTDTIWGGLYADGVTGTPVTPPGGVTTYWSETINSGQTVPKTISYPNGITSPISGYELRVGHQVFSLSTFGVTGEYNDYESNIDGYFRAQIGTPMSSGTAQSISVWVAGQLAYSGRVKCALYSQSGTYLGQTEERTITIGNTRRWETFNFIDNVSLTAGLAYIICVQAEVDIDGGGLLAGSTDGNGYGRASSYYDPTWPSTLTFTWIANQASMYCSYY